MFFVALVLLSSDDEQPLANRAIEAVRQAATMINLFFRIFKSSILSLYIYESYRLIVDYNTEAKAK